MITELIIIISVLVLALNLITKKTPGLPPGEWGWPIIGLLPNSKIGLSYYVDMFIKKYGKIFTWRMGRRTVVFISDYRILKSAFSNPLLCERPRIFSLDFYTGFQRFGITNTNGSKHQNLRRFTLKYLRDNGMGKSSMEEAINYETECLVKDFLNYADKITEVPLSLNVAILNVLWKVIAGKRYDLGDEKIQEYEKLAVALTKDFQTDLFHFYTLFPMVEKMIPNVLKRHLGLKMEFRNADRYIDFMSETIKEHQRTLVEEKPRDFIDKYLVDMKQDFERKESEISAEFTDLDLLYTVSDLFSGGSLAPAAVIRWFLLYMIKYPEIQKKNQSYIDEYVPRDRLPGLQDKEKLSYVEATIYEVMRLRPITKFGPFHCAKEDTTVENFSIPKGTIICPAISACQIDPEYWDNPYEFKPERFLFPDGSINSKKEGTLPFSIGRRSCPGESLARMEVYLIVSALFQKFNFSSPEGVVLDMESDPSSPIFAEPKTFKIFMTSRVIQ